MMKPIKLLNLTSSNAVAARLLADQVEADEWEIAWFNTDSRGLQIEPHLGVRVNGGDWMEATTIAKHIQMALADLPVPEHMR